MSHCRIVEKSVLLFSGTTSLQFLQVAIRDLDQLLPDAAQVELPQLGHDGPWSNGRPTAVVAAIRDFMTAEHPSSQDQPERPKRNAAYADCSGWAPTEPHLPVLVPPPLPATTAASRNRPPSPQPKKEIGPHAPQPHQPLLERRSTLAEKLVTHFGYRLIDSGEFPRHDGDGTQQYAYVTGTDQSEVVITQIDPAPENTFAYPKGFHFGLIQDTRHDVLAKHEELTTAGLQPGEISDGFEVWGAAWTAFYCPLGDGLEIEINYRPQSDLLDRGARPLPGSV